MRRHIPKFLLTSLILSIVTLFSLGGCSYQGHEKISIDTLNTQMDEPDITIIDVRQERDWKASTLKIKGAIRENPNKVASWAGKYATDRRIVVY